MKTFNTNAGCNPNIHYMVNIQQRLEAIKKMVDAGQYFTINCARQYGKTTTLQELEIFLKNDYIVLSLDFQMLSFKDFENEGSFVEAFAAEIMDIVSGLDSLPQETGEQLKEFAYGNNSNNSRLSKLFRCLSQWCKKSDKKIVLIIDEVDSAANNQVFIDFLSMLRGYYIHRERKPFFQSVVLSSVYDIKNIKIKLSGDSGYKVNSPWNIAADFSVNMSFLPEDIAGMLSEYEIDYKTGMDIKGISQMVYDYTSGYPFLVSRLCKIIDEQSGLWTKDGVLEAVKILLTEKNTLFESLTGKLQDYPGLKAILYSLLFYGQSIAYNPDDNIIGMAIMFGFIKTDKEKIIIANRIFETRIYNYFLTTAEMQDTNIYKAALKDKNQFIENGHLNMRRVLEKFVIHFNDLYGDMEQKFLEEDGRRFFLLYLKPIINGTGNYYIESQTRNMERTDVIVDYKGEQFIIELKIWHGDSYNSRGEKQLSDYMDYYHLKRGYMLSFNFNKKKETGLKEIRLGNRILTEAVV